MLSSVLTGRKSRMTRRRSSSRRIPRSPPPRTRARARGRTRARRSPRGQPEQAGDDVDHVVPAVHVEDAEHGVPGERVPRVEAGVVEEADDPGDRQRAAHEQRVQAGWAVCSIWFLLGNRAQPRMIHLRSVVADWAMRENRPIGSVAMNAEDLQRLADEDLMPLVARKDPAAFEVFYDRHGGAAYSLAHRSSATPPRPRT